MGCWRGCGVAACRWRKRNCNQEQPDGSKKEKKVSLFGYGTGVAACTDPVYGDLVVADFTQPFNEGDVTYFRPLYRHSVLALDAYPPNITADAAFEIGRASCRERG